LYFIAIYLAIVKYNHDITDPALSKEYCEKIFMINIFIQYNYLKV